MSNLKTFSDNINESTFIIKLLKVATPIYADHIKQSLEGGFEKDFQEYGTDNEKHIKEIMSFVISLQSYFEDLEKVIKYLSVAKSKIAALYNETLDAEEYYKYHYDNFVIRIMTSIDICGKVGISLYKLGILEKYANWHAFATHINVKSEKSAKEIIDFSAYLEEFRSHRHNKIHQGKSIDNRFDKVVFWEKIAETIGDSSINTPELEKYNEAQISEVVKEIVKVVEETSKLAVDFLNSMEDKLDAILLEYGYTA